MPRFFAFLTCGLVACDAVSLRASASKTKLNFCGSTCGTTMCARSACVVDYGACSGRSILNVDVGSKVSAPAPGPAPGPAAATPLVVGDLALVVGEKLPSKGMTFRVIDEDSAFKFKMGPDWVKLGNGRWYQRKYLQKVERKTIDPVQAKVLFCRVACATKFPVIPTYPNGKLDLDVAPTVTDSSPSCLRSCAAGTDLVNFCQRLCPDEGGMCLTECETMMQRCEDDATGHYNTTSRMSCVKKACTDLSFKEDLFMEKRLDPKESLEGKGTKWHDGSPAVH